MDTLRMRQMNALPNIPWIGPMRARELEERAIGRVTRFLAPERGARLRASSGSRGAGVLGLVLVAVGALLLHDSAPRGFLRAPAMPAAGEAGDSEMSRTRSLMAGVLGAGVLAGGASAQLNAEFTAWGNNTYGQCAIPSEPQLARIALGNLHSIGLTADGRVVAWGSDATAQCQVPPGIADAIQVAAGGWYLNSDQRGHSVALLRSGAVRAWGSNEYGQCDVPPTLASVVQIACGWAHTAALQLDGSVVVWGAGGFVSGDPNWGQAIVPADLGPASAIATKGCHMMVRRSDGTVRCWGRNTEGQCTLPAKLEFVTDIAAGSDHSVALTASGAVKCWGFNMHGQSDVPKGLGEVRAIAATLYGTLAVRADGQVIAWGQIDAPPKSLGESESIAAGGYHAVSMKPRDCNANAIRDSIELLTKRGFDDDGDTLLDTCEQTEPLPVLHDIVVTRGNIGPFPWPICGAWDSRTQVGDHLWDLWASRDGADGPWINRAEVPPGNPFSLGMTLKEGTNTIYCRMDQNGCTETLFSLNAWLDRAPAPSVSAQNSTPIAPYGGVIPGLTVNSSVNAAQTLVARSGAWTVRVSGFSMDSADDLVSPTSFASSGIADLVATVQLEVARACAGDVTGNGAVDGVDLAAVLGAWGTDGGGEFPCDVDHDGIVNGADLAQVLGSWGACP